MDAETVAKHFTRKKKWMQSAVPKSHKGLFGAKAKAAGYTTAEYAQKEASAPGTLGKEARLAKIFERQAK